MLCSVLGLKGVFVTARLEVGYGAHYFGAHYTYAHMNPRNYHLMKTYQQNTILGKYKFRVSYSKLTLEQNLKP